MDGVEEEPLLPSEQDRPANGKIWCLKRAGENGGWLRLFEKSEVTIGRGLNVTHQILSARYPLMISRNHCVLKQTEDGQWTVTDNESMNGVWVNGARIPPSKPHPVQQGDTIRFGVPLDDNPVEFEYILDHCILSRIKHFLTKTVVCEASGTASLPKPNKAKRKFTTDETGLLTTTPDSGSKLYRSSDMDKSNARPCPAALAEHGTGPTPGPPDQAGTSGPTGDTTDRGVGQQQIAALRRYNDNLRALKERMGQTQRRAAELQGSASPSQQQRMQALQEQLEVLRGQMSSQQEQALQRVDLLERSVCEEERRLEVENAQPKEDGLKKQLEEALKEHRKVIDELRHAREGFQEVLQAKDKELEVTKEEKEKAKAQKEEVVTQMTEVLENELQCIICSELFIEAVTLSCAHSFCQHCIRDWRRRKDECPICRQPIAAQTRSLVLDNCIDRMVENLSAEMRDRRQALVTQRKGERSARSRVRRKARN
ncbi:E3 ubiquitin-protein ligase rnf8 isoform X2 [Brachyhypopomus gauderio]|uniref:E3 ubiquitin-protein ligase rnf8 isoform X2 n=1 Tax=Brachyhypopomus gauderio TaxID=698409 RepID=UPI004042BC2E